MTKSPRTEKRVAKKFIFFLVLFYSKIKLIFVNSIGRNFFLKSKNKPIH